MLERVKFFGFDMDYTLAGKIDKHMGRSRGGGGGDRRSRHPPPPPEKSKKNIGFLGNTGPDPLKNHKVTKPVFNVGPSLACQRNTI